MKINARIKNQKGQGMVEYLIIVCLIAVGTMAVIRVVGKNVAVQYTNIATALGGEGEQRQAETVEESMYKKKDLTNFLQGAKSAKSKNSSGNGAGGFNTGDWDSHGGEE